MTPRPTKAAKKPTKTKPAAKPAAVPKSRPVARVKEAKPMAVVTELSTTSAIEQIGEAAGVIWRQLDQNGATSLTKLIKDLGLPRDVALSAIGWLAREDKLAIADEGRTRVVRLRDE